MPAPRKPRALKILAGTLQKVRDRPEPEFPLAGDPLEPPDWLINAEAVSEWRKDIALLQSVRVLTQADVKGVGHLANLHAAMVKLYRAGLEPTAAQFSQLRMMLGEFGMTPASRSKVRPGPEGASKNPFTKLTGSG